MGRRSAARTKVGKNGENQGRFRQPEENRSDKTGITVTSTPLKMFKDKGLVQQLDIKQSKCTRGGGEPLSPVPEEDSGYDSLLVQSPPPSPETSPTLEQALLLPLLDEQEGQQWADLYSRHLDSDYDLSDLVKCLKIKCGALLPPVLSPPTSISDIAISPRKLFGRISPTSPPSTTLPPLPPRLSWRAPPAARPPPTSEEEALEVETPPSTWSGHLPPKTRRNPSFSNKIFLGGVPWDVTEASLVQAFRFIKLSTFLLDFVGYIMTLFIRQFGPIRIEWPGKDNSPSPPKGYVYIIFDQVKTSSLSPI